ncbi:hypothetical protein LCGC14_1892570 [marine sediment metagenome]|uniref:Uncharacterized protein n=1 Tax=marine sediment metagenome TaxID=412755 RepID=A0A0F9FZ99_9ZZZZ
MARVFVYDGREFPDPDPSLSTDDVRAHYANFFPELSNAETKSVKRGEDDVIEFKKRVGTKGMANTKECPLCGCEITRIEAVKTSLEWDGEKWVLATGSDYQEACPECRGAFDTGDLALLGVPSGIIARALGAH